MNNEHSTIIGTLGGTFLALITVNAGTIVASVTVAAVGATTSFFVSLFLKWITEKIKTKFNKKWKKRLF